MDTLPKRHQRVRKKIKGTAHRPRLAIHKSDRHIYAQLIDDTIQKSLVAASTLSPQIRKEKLVANIKSARLVGKLIGEKALEAGIKNVVFDRGGHLYHGKVKALAEAARKAGLQF